MSRLVKLARPAIITGAAALAAYAGLPDRPDVAGVGVERRGDAVKANIPGLGGIAGFVTGGGTVPYDEGTAGTKGGNTTFNSTMGNRAFAIDNDATINQFELEFNGAGSGVKFKIFSRNGAGDYTEVYTQTVSVAGTGKETFNMTTPYVVPSSGTYHAAVFNNSLSYAFYGANARFYKAGDNGTGTGYTEDTSNAPFLRVIGTKPA